jgi:hypothetical protein
MRFRYETHKVTTINREDVTTALIERVLRDLVFHGSPQRYPFDFPTWLDVLSFTLDVVEGKSYLRAEWDLTEDSASHPQIPEDERKQIEEMLQLVGAENTWFVVIPLTEEDMNTWVEFHVAKDLTDAEAAKAAKETP